MIASCDEHAVYLQGYRCLQCINQCSKECSGCVPFNKETYKSLIANNWKNTPASRKTCSMKYSGSGSRHRLCPQMVVVNIRFKLASCLRPISYRHCVAPREQYLAKINVISVHCIMDVCSPAGIELYILTYQHNYEGEQIVSSQYANSLLAWFLWGICFGVFLVFHLQAQFLCTNCTNFLPRVQVKWCSEHCARSRLQS